MIARKRLPEHRNYNASEKLKAVKMRLAGVSPMEVAKDMNCDESSVRRWKSQFDGTVASLENQSSRPKSKHPNAQTDEEESWIKEIVENPDNAEKCINELFGIMRTKYDYTRHHDTFAKYLRNNYPDKIMEHEKYKPKTYHSAKQLGQKMQQDVKVVPSECYQELYDKGERWYQFTILDEASKERVLGGYKEQTAENSVDFTNNAINKLGYIPKIVQTDNGKEVATPNKKNVKLDTVHLFDQFCQELDIYHQLIKPYTPRHQGKVERSHRTDMDCFYNCHKGDKQFKNFEDYTMQLAEWNERYNNMPNSSLYNCKGKKCWLTPYQKRKELLEDLHAGGNKENIWFL